MFLGGGMFYYTVGFVILFLITISFFLKLKLTQDKIIYCLFLIYILGAISKVYFPIPFEHGFLEIFKEMRPLDNNIDWINLIPFKGAFGRHIKHSFLNILLFVPLGTFTYYFSKKIKTTFIVVIISTFVIEISQLLANILYGFAYRIVDINDIIFNITGGIIGMIIMIVIFKVNLNLFGINFKNKD